MMTGKTTLSTLAAPPPMDCETIRRRAHELELPKAIESNSLSVGEAVIRRMPIQSSRQTAAQDHTRDGYQVSYQGAREIFGDHPRGERTQIRSSSRFAGKLR
jgi:hypothetical protein